MPEALIQIKSKTFFTSKSNRLQAINVFIITWGQTT